MTSNILKNAQQLGKDQGLPYTGAITPEEAWALLQADQNILLVDVRTNAERDWVGRAHIPETQHCAVQWSMYPGGTPNPNFMAELATAVPNKGTTILFLCRSGVRSRHGAKLATEHGYTQCYDILQGFEGDKDVHGHRKTIGGWCSADLPWVGA
jgi:rhodanese-related sulfurtransferase